MAHWSFKLVHQNKLIDHYEHPITSESAPSPLFVEGKGDRVRGWHFKRYDDETQANSDWVCHFMFIGGALKVNVDLADTYIKPQSPHPQFNRNSRFKLDYSTSDRKFFAIIRSGDTIEFDYHNASIDVEFRLEPSKSKVEVESSGRGGNPVVVKIEEDTQLDRVDEEVEATQKSIPPPRDESQLFSTSRENLSQSTPRRRDSEVVKETPRRGQLKHQPDSMVADSINMAESSDHNPTSSRPGPTFTSDTQDVEGPAPSLTEGHEDPLHGSPNIDKDGYLLFQAQSDRIKSSTDDKIDMVIQSVIPSNPPSQIPPMPKSALAAPRRSELRFEPTPEHAEVSQGEDVTGPLEKPESRDDPAEDTDSTDEPDSTAESTAAKEAAVAEKGQEAAAAEESESAQEPAADEPEPVPVVDSEAMDVRGETLNVTDDTDLTNNQEGSAGMTEAVSAETPKLDERVESHFKKPVTAPRRSRAPKTPASTTSRASVQQDEYHDEDDSVISVASRTPSSSASAKSTKTPGTKGRSGKRKRVSAIDPPVPSRTTKRTRVSADGEETNATPTSSASKRGSRRKSIDTLQNDTPYQGPAPRILFSNTSVQDRKMLMGFLKKQGAEKTESTKQDKSNFLCVGGDEIKTTAKLLHSLTQGKTIVTDDWVVQSSKVDYLLDPVDFVPPSLQASIDLDRKQIFENHVMYITPALRLDYRSGWDDITSIVEEAGGPKPLTGPLGKLVDQDRITIFVGLENNDPVAAQLQDSGHTVHKKEIIASSIIQGSLLLEDKDLILPTAKKSQKTAKTPPAKSTRGQRRK